MKKTFLLSFMLMGLIVAIPAMAAKVTPAKEPSVKDTQKQIKIGIVDMQKILRESKAAKAARGGFMKDLEDKKAQIIDRAKDVQKQEEELNRLDPSASVETRRQKSDKLKHDARELNNLRQDVEADVKRKEIEIAQHLFVEIMQVLRNYAKQERYSLILERSTIVVAEESIDITDKILKLYDAQKK